MKAGVFGLVGVLGCGSVHTTAPGDAAGSDSAGIDAMIDAAVDAAVDAGDVSPHVIFVTSTTQSCAMAGLDGADGICQMLAQNAALTGTFKAWLADPSGSPATRMTHHLGPYQLVTGVVVAQSWSDLTDGTLAAKINRTETGAELPGVGCNPLQQTCHFVCEGGEVWSNVDAAGNRRAVDDCNGWILPGTGTAGNNDKTDATWTAGTCTRIGNAALPIFCVQQ